MPKFSASQGAVHTTALFAGGQRFQVITPIIATTSWVIGEDGENFCNWWETTIVPLYRAILATDCAIIGQQIEEMVEGNLIPYRVNYAFDTFPGTIGGRSYSQQVSVLGCWYSSQQIDEQARTHTGKSFFGPPPESKCDQNVLDVTYGSTTVGALMDAIMTGTTLVSGTAVRRGLARRDQELDDVYQVDFRAARTSVFTQRRRLTPLF